MICKMQMHAMLSGVASCSARIFAPLATSSLLWPPKQPSRRKRGLESPPRHRGLRTQEFDSESTNHWCVQGQPVRLGKRYGQVNPGRCPVLTVASISRVSHRDAPPWLDKFPQIYKSCCRHWLSAIVFDLGYGLWRGVTSESSSWQHGGLSTSWRGIFEGPKTIIAVLNEATLLVFDDYTKERCIAAFLLAKKKAYAGDPATRRLPFPGSLTRSGYPTIIPSFPRRMIY
ncbi:hypothetical protein SLEP1_g58912 [Rubroshorea leprosula]|uniref:Uncharacterized protein n=1 Tax=Rubroshorea leprosula TaxID=152421 RepID=A0AAV5MU15_9ROSI|nr:hypothetical protein SLEP1_g58912 [Rubroshorea leprosula]